MMVNEQFMNTFSKRLRQLRNEANLSMDEFCEKFNAKFGAKLNKSTVSRYENGSQEPMVSLVKNFAIFFNTSPDYLLGYDENTNHEIHTLAAHHDGGDKWTDEEQQLLDRFKKTLLSMRNEK